MMVVPEMPYKKVKLLFELRGRVPNLSWSHLRRANWMSACHMYKNLSVGRLAAQKLWSLTKTYSKISILFHFEEEISILVQIIGMKPNLGWLEKQFFIYATLIRVSRSPYCWVRLSPLAYYFLGSKMSKIACAHSTKKSSPFLYPKILILQPYFCAYTFTNYHFLEFEMQFVKVF